MSSVSSFHGLQTALRGLLAHQRAIDVTGHNIGNSDTVGYSRQSVDLAAAPSLRIAAGALQQGGGADLGTGVDVVAYRRIRDGFLDLQYRAQNMALGEQEARSRSLDQAELAFGEPSDTGLSALLGKLWSAWGDVANAPESTAARQAVVDQARIVADAFARLDGDLAAVAAGAATDVTALTAPGGEVDAMAREIAALNAAISRAVGAGTQPNDLLDRRDLLLDRLSALARVSVTDLGNGSISVAFGDAAVALVDDTTVTWPQVLTQAAGGRIGALVDVSRAGGVVDTYRAELSAAARLLADGINALHNPGGTGTDFFSYTAGSEASTLAVAVTAAGVRTGTSTAPGANDIAIAIAALRGGAADSRYQQLVSRVGTETAEAARAAHSARVLTGSTDDRRQSVAGVSLDEEMAALVRFQRGYQASARAMSTLDEMLDTLINRTGRVGL
ncbi:MAG: flagellar hook-associated protein FlgK [Actinomycetota bacterium]|nr:flagellar hook-associated protein FlgK [Actinomycetota bacterium]